MLKPSIRLSIHKTDCSPSGPGRLNEASRLRYDYFSATHFSIRASKLGLQNQSQDWAGRLGGVIMLSNSQYGKTEMYWAVLVSLVNACASKCTVISSFSFSRGTETSFTKINLKFYLKEIPNYILCCRFLKVYL